MKIIGHVGRMGFDDGDRTKKPRHREGDRAFVARVCAVLA